MGEKKANEDAERRRKRLRDLFSNYEIAVGVISALQAWFEFRWGPDGKVRAGLLEVFNRFPHVGDLKPDFEVRFRTPYIIWGDHKRTMQPSEKKRDDKDQIMGYAMHRPPAIGGGPSPAFDVMVLVRPENDAVAAKAIDDARNELLKAALASAEPVPAIASVVVLGCYLNGESNQDWYILNWRDHHNNRRFSTPNISPDGDEDLNSLLVVPTHHAIPIKKSALELEARAPFINDIPPGIYTAVRIVIPALNTLLTEEERDELQARGSVEKVITKADVMGSLIVQGLAPSPPGLGAWVDSALEFLSDELRCARKLTGLDPVQYQITINNHLINSDVKELLSDKAGQRAAREAKKASSRFKKPTVQKNQWNLFDGGAQSGV